MNYNEFNKILNSILLFDGRFKQRPIFLDLEDDIKEELSNRIEISKLDFDQYLGQIVKSKLSDESNPYSRIDLDLRVENVPTSRLPPPFTSLLCLLSFSS